MIEDFVTPGVNGLRVSERGSPGSVFVRGSRIVVKCATA